MTPSLSNTRIFAKSLHWLALGWAIAVLWLCWAQWQRSHLFDAEIHYQVDTLGTLLEGGIPALLIEICAFLTIALIGKAPTGTVERREWWYAFIWSLFPNIMIFYTVYMMIAGEA
jgi:hypothetical protein